MEPVGWTAGADASGGVPGAAATWTHTRAGDTRTDEDVEREVLGPARLLERVLGRRPAAFAWFHGAAWGESRLADVALQAAGYRHVFSNTKIQRIG